MRIRLSLLLVIVTPILLLLGYTSYWFYAADAVRSGIETWIVEQRANGMGVESEDLDVGGFPLMLTADARDVVMTRRDGAQWRSSGLSAETRPWRMTDIDFRIDGPQTLTVPGTEPLIVSAADGVGDLRLAQDGRLSAGNVSISDVMVLVPAFGDLRVASVELTITERLNGAVVADVSAQSDALQLDLPVSPLPALGKRVDQAELDVTISAPIPQEMRVPQLTLWRDSGGKVHIDRFTFEWGPLQVEASGTVTLDATLQPQAELTAKVRGFSETIDALVEAGMVPSENAPLIKAGLALLARPSGADGVETLTAPLSLRSRRLSLGPLQLAELPPIAWR